jgi:hypothetical protein
LIRSLARSEDGAPRSDFAAYQQVVEKCKDRAAEAARFFMFPLVSGLEG